MATAARLVRIVLILALLPGLLLAEGERLRVCLHHLTGQADICVKQTQATSGCCAAQDFEGPVWAGEPSPCDGCCVELAGQATERTGPAPRAGSSSALVFALPPRVEVAALILAPACAPSARAWLAPSQPPGRAPTPLRI